MTAPGATWNFLIGLWGLSYGYNIWPKRVIPVTGPDKKGRGLISFGYIFVGLAIVQMFLLSSGIVKPHLPGERAARAAMQKFRSDAEAGNYKAMYHIGVLYENGEGVSRSLPKAIQWYRRAAAGEFPAAMVQIGVLYQDGYGVAENYRQAMIWYRRAAAKGSPIAAFLVGSLYYNGRGVHRDFPIAIAWWQKASREGSKDAMIGMAVAYAYGRGVPQNSRKSIEWLRRAAAAGSVRAKKLLESNRPEIDKYLIRSK
ncbi:MAG: tetratricopeptide repeat protein [Phycisphaerae bacterium]